MRYLIEKRVEEIAERFCGYSAFGKNDPLFLKNATKLSWRWTDEKEAEDFAFELCLKNPELIGTLFISKVRNRRARKND
jgi:hypothetical protein